MRKINSEAHLSKYLEELALSGQYYFTVREILENLSIKEKSLSVSLSRLAKKNKVKMIRNGFGIYTGHTSGVLDISYFIDAMMKHLDSKYYVGALSAAAYWGASHQAVMKYFVISEKVIKPVSLGPINIEFVNKKDFNQDYGIKKVAGVGGYFLISTPEQTAIDIVRYPRRSGYLNNVATVLEDLVDKIDFEKLKKLCKKEHTPTVTIQRLGFIIDKVLGMEKEAEYILDALCERNPSRVKLSVSKKGRKLSDDPLDKKWLIYINTSVEPD